MSRIVLTKFVLASGALLGVGLPLVLLSTRMMDSAPALQAAACAVMGAVTVAVCGLSTGLGAVFLDLRQSNPAAIVSGFGGTLNLVLSLAFMLAAILPYAAIFHWRNVLNMPDGPYRHVLVFTAIGLGVMTLFAAGVPLWIGIRSLRNRDF